MFVHGSSQAYVNQPKVVDEPKPVVTEEPDVFIKKWSSNEIYYNPVLEVWVDKVASTTKKPQVSTIFKAITTTTTTKATSTTTTRKTSPSTTTVKSSTTVTTKKTTQVTTISASTSTFLLIDLLQLDYHSK